LHYDLGSAKDTTHPIYYLTKPVPVIKSSHKLLFHKIAHCGNIALSVGFISDLS
jgi:hypothetical protein